MDDLTSSLGPLSWRDHGWLWCPFTDVTWARNKRFDESFAISDLHSLDLSTYTNNSILKRKIPSGPFSYSRSNIIIVPLSHCRQKIGGWSNLAVWWSLLKHQNCTFWRQNFTQSHGDDVLGQTSINMSRLDSGDKLSWNTVCQSSRLLPPAAPTPTPCTHTYALKT